MFARISTVVLYALLALTSIATARPNPDVSLALRQNLFMLTSPYVLQSTIHQVVPARLEPDPGPPPVPLFPKLEPDPGPPPVPLFPKFD